MEESQEIRSRRGKPFSSVLIEALPRIASWVEDDGRLILSGILVDQWPQVREQAANCRFSCLEEGDWQVGDRLVPFESGRDGKRIKNKARETAFPLHGMQSRCRTTPLPGGNALSAISDVFSRFFGSI